VKPRFQRCRKGGRHHLVKRKFALGYGGKDFEEYSGQKIVRQLPEMGTVWYCTKCKGRWKR
jgi:hypothetical protein